jgi:hypothetical protein
MGGHASGLMICSDGSILYTERSEQSSKKTNLPFIKTHAKFVWGERGDLLLTAAQNLLITGVICI